MKLCSPEISCHALVSLVLLLSFPCKGPLMNGTTTKFLGQYKQLIFCPTFVLISKYLGFTFLCEPQTFLGYSQMYNL